MNPSKVAVEAGHIDIVRDILARHLPRESRVWIFGSRARGVGVRRGSDLDLAVDAGAELTLSTEARLAEDFSESLLPYTVDVVDLRSVTPAFRAAIERDLRSFPLAGAANGGVQTGPQAIGVAQPVSTVKLF
jgi:predicted nucleotidyltransferase